MKTNKSLKKTTFGALILSSICLVAFHLASGTQAEAAHAHAELRVRAAKIFAFDRDHKAVLPAHHVRALSLALEFHDDVGAEQILSSLEQAI